MHKVIFFLFFLVIVYGIYNAQKKKTTHVQSRAENCEVCQIEEGKFSHLQTELARINTSEYVKQYIIDVINHGSDTLGFKGGVMEGGYVSPEDAPKIACYVLELSDKKCSESYPEDAAMFFTSVCGGCHGNDGKGLGGNYPDLTRKKLLGIERREIFLKQQLEKIQNQDGHRH